MGSLNVRYNNDKSRDYTNPGLPTGEPGGLVDPYSLAAFGGGLVAAAAAAAGNPTGGGSNNGNSFMHHQMAAAAAAGGGAPGGPNHHALFVGKFFFVLNCSLYIVMPFVTRVETG